MKTPKFHKAFLCVCVFLLSHIVYAQQRSISGVVSDAKTNAPLSGVSVAAGSGNGTLTNSIGEFKLSIPLQTHTLTITYVGYASKTVNIDTSLQVNVSLEASDKALEDIVVVGYGTLKRKEITSAVASVKAGDFKQGGSSNVMDLIQGKVAGLTITQKSGNNPNSSSFIQLRGLTSVNGDMSPLVVIDGIPGGNLDMLQQSDIESIDVLKDGSAAAIYGTRANGGVILITTKKGKSGPPKYDYSTWFRKDYIAYLPKTMNAAQYREKIKEGVINEINDKGSSTDWADQLVNHHNLSQYHNLALSGGDDKLNYRGDIFWTDYQGIAKKDASMKYGGRLSINQKGFNDRLTTQVNLGITYNKANLLGAPGDAASGIPYLPSVSTDGTYWENALFQLNPTQGIYNADGTYWNDNQVTNIVARLNQEQYTRDQETSVAQFKSTLDIFQGIKAAVSGSVQKDQFEDNIYKDINSQSSLNDGDYPGGGYAYKGNYQSTDYSVEPTIEYNSQFSSIHSISAVAGYSYQYHEDDGFYAANKGFFNDVFENNNLGSGDALGTGKAAMGSGKYVNKLIAFFGRINYSYKSKYIAQVILRREGSTRFGVNNKWGNFPAASVGWAISQEDFMKNVKWVNYLKLRAGYGVTGNQGFANGVSLYTMGTGGYYLYPDGTWKQTYGQDKNPNPDLRWEKKGEWNIGADFTLFNQKLTGSIDVFSRTTTDLIYSYKSQQPSYTQSSIVSNVGSIKNSGVELTLGAIPIQTKDFSWHIDATGSHSTSILSKFSNDVYQANYLTSGGIGGPGALGDAIRTYEGGKMGQFYGKRFAGIDKDGQWLFYKADGTKVHFSDITDQDLAYIGNGIPKIYASLTNTFSYKNFSLRVFFRGKFGYKILNTMAITYGNQAQLPNNLLLSAFTKYNTLKDTYQYSDFYLENGNFVKLDELTFSYKVPIENKYIRSLNVYITASGLARFTKYTGNDPDFVNDTGLGPSVDAQGVYPSTRSFLFGLNLGF